MKNRTYKLKKIIELVKEYQWDSGENGKEAELIASQIYQICLKRIPSIPFKRVQCEFSEHGIKTFKKKKYGYIVGEGRDKRSWIVIWNNTKYRHGYAKDFIKKSD